MSISESRCLVVAMLFARFVTSSGAAALVGRLVCPLSRLQAFGFQRSRWLLTDCMVSYSNRGPPYISGKLVKEDEARDLENAIAVFS